MAAIRQRRPQPRHRPVKRKSVPCSDILQEISRMSIAAIREFDPDITDVLSRAPAADRRSFDALLPQIYATLRRLAHRQRGHEGAHTLGTTALVNEAYLVMARQNGIAFADRAHLFAYVARTMRHILIDRARRHAAQKRQAGDVDVGTEPVAPIDALALDQALDQLARVDARLARVAELRLFAGLSAAEIATIEAINPRTIERDWLKARTFLSGCLSHDA